VPFVLLSVLKSVILPLFPRAARDQILAEFGELLGDAHFNSSFFLTLEDIIGSSDPVVLSLMSKDKLIVVFDPYGSEFELLSSQTLPALAQWDFVFTEPDSNSFVQSVTDAASGGAILVIKHGDSVVEDPFFNSITSGVVSSGFFMENPLTIDNEFRVVLLVDRCPRSILPHVSFIHCAEIGKAKLQSVVMNSDLPVTAANKLLSSRVMLQSQLDNFYISLQSLNTRLREIHASSVDVLTDVLMQSQLLQTAFKNYNDSQVFSDHLMNAHRHNAAREAEVERFVGKLEDLHQLSPLYLWPLEKIRETVAALGKSEDLSGDLFSVLATSVLGEHRAQIEELKEVNPKPIVPGKWNVLHFMDWKFAALYLLELSKDGVPQVLVSVKSDSVFNFAVFREGMKSGSNIIFAFYEENDKFATDAYDVLTKEEVECDWSANSRLFFATRTNSELPVKLLRICSVFALE
jgi:hypothetical protein